MCGRLYVKELLNLLDKGIIPEEMVYFVPEQYITAAYKQETSAIVGELKDNRAAGKDSITREVAKDGGRIMWYKIHTLMNRV